MKGLEAFLLFPIVAVICLLPFCIGLFYLVLASKQLLNKEQDKGFKKNAKWVFGLSLSIILASVVAWLYFILA
jgi:hypothetical protein